MNSFSNTGSPTTSEKPLSMKRSKLLHYRDPDMDDWLNYKIKYVKLALYEEKAEVAYVTFNATGSDMNSWFERSRVLSSSFPDLTSAALYNHFSIAGDAGNKLRF